MLSLHQLPNLISTLRILLVPVWVVVAETCRTAAIEGRDPEPWRMVALGLLLLIGFSDVFDGWLARRFDLASRTGAVLDAVADKLAQVTVLTFFWLRGPPAFAQLPLWFVLVLMSRDGLLATGWALMRLSGTRPNVTHHWHGKASSLALFLLMLGWTVSSTGKWSIYVLPILAAGIVASTLSYARDGWLLTRTDSSKKQSPHAG